MPYPKLGTPLARNDLIPGLLYGFPGLQWLTWSMRHALTSDLGQP